MRRPFHSKLDASPERGAVLLFRAALGPLADDPVAMAVTRTAVGPPLYYALRTTGVSRSDALEAGLDVLMPWLRRRLAAGGDE
jgi:hypothetical protein